MMLDALKRASAARRLRSSPTSAMRGRIGDRVGARADLRQGRRRHDRRVRRQPRAHVDLHADQIQGFFDIRSTTSTLAGAARRHLARKYET